MKGEIELYKKLKSEALNPYNSKKYLFDPYTEHFNKIYLTTITEQ